jgi:hypothetical protein
MQLHQIKIDFDPVQDRLLMCIATNDGKELLLWLTRRCVKLMWPLMLKMIEASPRIQRVGTSAEARAALLEIEHQKAVQQADFSKPYQGASREHPLGSEPILVSRIHSGRDDSGNHLLTLLPAQGSGVNLALEDNMLHSCCKLLQNAVVKAQWDYRLDFPEAPLAPPEEQGRTRTLN